MKKLSILLFFIAIHSYVHAQRYLTYVYPQIDSIIGGTYGSSINYLGNNQNLLFDFYSPQSDTAQKRPIIIYIHGGGFNSGTRDYTSVKLLCRKMAMKGYATVTIDYRLDPGFDLYNSNTNRRAMTDAMQDAKQAIRYFKANSNMYKIDTNKIFIGGESAGAITAMMSSYIDKQAKMNFYPMANPNNPIGSTSNAHVGNDVQATICLCGMIIDTTAMENSNNSPILWVHGSSDPFIPISLAFNVVLRAYHIGLPYQTKVYQNATHCPWYYGTPDWDKYLDSTIHEITYFLYPKINTTLGVNEIQKDEISLRLYPNPNVGDITIDFDTEYSTINISILSSTGQTCDTWNFNNTQKVHLDLQKLASGLYFIKIELNNTVVTRKILISGK